MKDGETVLHPEWVWTEEGLRTGMRVVLTTEIVEVRERDRQSEGIDLSGKLLLPGFVNAHSHAFQRAFRGQVQHTDRAESDFWTWRDRMYAVANGLDPEGIGAVSRLAFLEMAEAGFTSVGEFHYLHRQPDGTPYDDPDAIAHAVIAAALDVGIRIVLLRVVYARGGLDQPLGPLQQRFRTDSADEALRAVSRLGGHPDPRVSVGLAPHSVRAVPVEWLAELASFAGPIHAHVSEQTAEVEATLAATGQTPLRLLHSHGLVHSRFTAVHLTHPRSGELDLLRAAEGHIAVCPTTELDLGDGFLPVEARNGIRLCVGSDSQAQIDGLVEARALEMHARGLARRRVVMGIPGDRHSLARRLLGALTHQGAHALGLESGIRVGAPADVVAVDLDRPAADGAPPLEATVFAGSADWVRDVWVAGRQIVREGRHTSRDALRAGARPFLEV